MPDPETLDGEPQRRGVETLAEWIRGIDAA